MQHHLQLITMSNQQIISIQMVPAGVNLVLNALSRMPYAEVAPLIAEIRGQADYQIQAMQAAEQKPAEPETQPATTEGGAQQ